MDVCKRLIMCRFRLLILLLLAVCSVQAADFRMGQLCFNVIDTTTKEVEVTYQRLRSQENYFHVTDLRIPEAIMVDTTIYVVTRIGNWAFFPCADLQHITIPRTIRSIGRAAFSSCISLREINLPDSLESIGDGAFTNCRMLKEVILPDSLKHMGESVFALCTKISSVRIPDAVDTIGNSMFYSCPSLCEVYLPRNLRYIDSEAFCSCPALQTLYSYSDMVPDVHPKAFSIRRRAQVSLWVKEEYWEAFYDVFNPLLVGILTFDE